MDFVGVGTVSALVEKAQPINIINNVIVPQAYPPFNSLNSDGLEEDDFKFIVTHL